MKKRLLAEFVGTFGIVFAPCALSATASLQGGAAGLGAAAVVSGLAVLAMIATFGPISAAHFNPAVTLAFAAARRFPLSQVVPYVAAQLGGAVTAAGLVTLLFGAGHGTHIPAGSIAQSLGLEFILSLVLMIVIIAVATDKRVPGSTPPIAIGLVVVVNVLIGGPVTGGSMNPARSLGPALFTGGPALSNMWIYILAPICGAAAGALLYEAIRAEPEFAKSAP